VTPTIGGEIDDDIEDDGGPDERDEHRAEATALHREALEGIPARPPRPPQIPAHRSAATALYTVKRGRATPAIPARGGATVLRPGMNFAIRSERTP